MAPRVRVERRLAPEPQARAETVYADSIEGLLLTGVGRPRSQTLAAPSLLDLVIQETMDRPARELLDKVLRRAEMDALARQLARRVVEFDPWALRNAAGASRAVASAARIAGRFGGWQGQVAQMLIERGIPFEWSSLLEALRQPSQAWAFLASLGLTWPTGWASPQEAPGSVWNGADQMVRHDATQPDWSIEYWRYVPGSPTIYWPDFVFYPPFNPTVSGQYVAWLGQFSNPNPGFVTHKHTAWAKWTGANTAPADLPQPSRKPPQPVPLDGDREAFKGALSWAMAARKEPQSGFPNGWDGGYTVPGELGLVVLPRTRTRPQRQGPPPPPKPPRYRGGSELKLTMGAYKRMLVVRVLEAATETQDFIGAVHNALPKEIQRICRQRWVEREFARGVTRPSRSMPAADKALCIYQFFRFLDPEGVVREILWEHIQDALIGRSGQALAGGLAGATGGRRTQALTSSNALGNTSDAMADLIGKLQDTVTGREARQARQTKDELVRQEAIAERIRRTNNRAAERHRRQEFRRSQRERQHGSSS